MNCYKCLYTKHLVKKRKTWEDGFLVKQANGSVNLFDSDGRQLHEGVRVPAEALASGSPLKQFSGLLVTVDEPCDASELPSVATAGVAGSTATRKPDTQPADTPAPSAAAAPAQRRHVPVIGMRRPAGSFMAPRPLNTQEPRNAAATLPNNSSGGLGGEQTRVVHSHNRAPPTGQAPPTEQRCNLAKPLVLAFAEPAQEQLAPPSIPWEQPRCRSACAISRSANGTGAAWADGNREMPSRQHTPAAPSAQDNNGRTDDDILALLGLAPEPQSASAADAHTGWSAWLSGSCSGVLAPKAHAPRSAWNAAASTAPDCRQPAPPPHLQNHQHLGQPQQQLRGGQPPRHGANLWGAFDVDFDDPHGADPDRDDPDGDSLREPRCDPNAAKPVAPPAARWSTSPTAGGEAGGGKMHGASGWGSHAASLHSDAAVARTGPGTGAERRGCGNWSPPPPGWDAGADEPVAAAALDLTAPRRGCPVQPQHGAGPSSTQVAAARRRWGVDSDAATATGADPLTHPSHAGGDQRRLQVASGPRPAHAAPRQAPGSSGALAHKRSNGWGAFGDSQAIELLDDELPADQGHNADAWGPAALGPTLPATAAQVAMPPRGADWAPHGTAATAGVGGNGAVKGNAAAARARWLAPQTGQAPTEAFPGAHPGPGGAPAQQARAPQLPWRSAGPPTHAPPHAEAAAAGGTAPPAAIVPAAPPKPSAWKAPAMVARPSTGPAAGPHAHGGSGAMGASSRGSGGSGSPGASDADLLTGLSMPPIDKPAVPQRLVAIPARFAGVDMYRSTLVSALVEELNLRLAESVQQLYGIARRLQNAAPPGAGGGGRPGGAPHQQQLQQRPGFSSGRGPPGMSAGAQQAAGPGGGGGFARLPAPAQAAQLERACQPCHVPYFASCTLSCWVNRPDGGYGGGGGKKKRRGRGGGGGGGEDEDDGDGPSTSAPKTSYYLTIPSARSRLKNTRRYDLWVISSDPLLQGPDAARGRPGHVGGWRAICRSLWHGPDRDGKFEVEMLTALPPGTFRSQAVYALRGPDVQSEVQMVQLLQTIGQQASSLSVAAGAGGSAAAGASAGGGLPLPLLRHLLSVQLAGQPMDLAATAATVPAQGTGGGGEGSRPFKRPRAAAGAATASDGAAADDADGTAEADVAPPSAVFDPAVIARRHVKRFRLNGDQAAVLLHCASWFKAHKPPPGCANTAGGCKRRTGRVKGGSDKAVPDADGGCSFGLQEGANCAARSDNDGDDELELDELDFVDRPAARQIAGQPSSSKDGEVGGKRRSRKGRRAVVEDSDEEGVEAELDDDGDHDGSDGEEGAAPQAELECQPPVCLVHGPFGSGKSSLLVALILMLVELSREQQRAAAAAAGGRKGRGKKAATGGPPPVRVLLASHTNVAVDRVLIGLQDAGFSEFLRLGSVDRIAKPVLHRSLRAGDDSRDTATELRRALKDATTPSDVAYIEAELAALAAGAEKQRRRSLRTCPVVGATVCSLLQPSSEDGCGGSFMVVVLDECSQMTEPLCLVPLLRAKARFLVAAGDPLQLPPVIANPASLSPPPSASALAAADGPADSLLRPLFVRLSQLGHRPHLLSYQYRCHPMLSRIANNAFYEGRLRDGCAEADRRALLPGLPPLTFVEAAGQAQVDGATRSSYNTAEAQVVSRAVAAMLDAGVEADSVGVICFYRAQVNAIRRALHAAAGAAAGPPARPAAGGAGAGGAGASGAGGDGERDAAGEGARGGEARGGGGGVQVATVDSFQGAEKEVIILATTVSRAADFAADAKRLNVALTRGRRHLIVVGSPAALSQTSVVFRDIIHTCQAAMRQPQQQCQLQGSSAAGTVGSAVYVSASGLLRLLGPEGATASGAGASGARTQPSAQSAQPHHQGHEQSYQHRPEPQCRPGQWPPHQQPQYQGQKQQQQQKQHPPRAPAGVGNGAVGQEGPHSRWQQQQQQCHAPPLAPLPAWAACSTGQQLQRWAAGQQLPTLPPQSGCAPPAEAPALQAAGLQWDMHAHGQEQQPVNVLPVQRSDISAAGDEQQDEVEEVAEQEGARGEAWGASRAQGTGRELGQGPAPKPLHARAQQQDESLSDMEDFLQDVGDEGFGGSPDAA